MKHSSVFPILGVCFYLGCTSNNVQTKTNELQDSTAIGVTPGVDTISCMRHIYDNRTGKVFAVSKSGERLFEIYIYDNGADYIAEGLFRMKKNNKVGFADTSGKIVIEPQYDFASPFENGKSTVCKGCVKVDHIYSGGQWGVIDKNGNIIEPLIHTRLDLDTSGN